MIDHKSLPSSEAQQLNEIPSIDSEFKLTYTGNIDEKKLYNDLNRRLTILEKSLDINIHELELIKNMAIEFRVASDEKEEVLLRIDWLFRLYKAKEDMESVDTKEKAKLLRRLIASVQTCPIKAQLLEQIDLLEQSFPEEEMRMVELSKDQLLMEKAIEETDSVFINLGKFGREFVIADVLERFGENASVENVKDSAIALEQSVKCLAEVKDRNKFLTCLDQLPLQSLSSLDGRRKEVITEYLIESGNWNGLLSLDQLIDQLDKKITEEQKKREEMENTIITPDGKAVLTLNVKIDEHNIFKIGKD